MMAHKRVIVQGSGGKQFLRAFGARYALWLNLRGRRRGLCTQNRSRKQLRGLAIAFMGAWTAQFLQEQGLGQFFL